MKNEIKCKPSISFGRTILANCAIYSGLLCSKKNRFPKCCKGKDMTYSSLRELRVYNSAC